MRWSPGSFTSEDASQFPGEQSMFRQIIFKLYHRLMNPLYKRLHGDLSKDFQKISEEHARFQSSLLQRMIDELVTVHRLVENGKSASQPSFFESGPSISVLDGRKF